MLWYLWEIGFGDLNIITKDPVVTYLQRFDAGFFLFLAFQVSQVLFCALGCHTELIQLFIKALSDDIAVT